MDPFFGMTFVFPLDMITKVFLVSMMIRPEIPSKDLFLENITVS